MKLLIDIGNTYAKFKYENKDVIRIETKNIIDESYLLDYFKDDNSSISSCVISSVVINKDEIVKSYINKKYKINPLIISKELKSQVIYPKKEDNELGSDLISLMEGCVNYSDTFIAISLGTATVINFVKDKVFMGCAIAPGILTSMNGLINSASLLKNTILKGDYKLLGMNTNESLRSGVYNTFIFTIERFVHEIEKTYNIKNVDIFITGGFSKELEHKLNVKATFDDLLIFKGMETLLKENSND